ncbi:MAG: hypothetical protein GY811_15580 [Myxococcales bacterium]|nr:hypothetical protein [Myxococcales bacterium]
MLEVRLPETLHEHLRIASFDLTGHKTKKEFFVEETVLDGLVFSQLQTVEYAAKTELLEKRYEFINGAPDWPPPMHRAARADCEHVFGAPSSV